MMCATAAPQSTMIHSPLSSPSMRGLGKPASRTASRTLAASALVWRFEVPEATITRSNSGERCSVLKTWMSCAFDVLQSIDDGPLELSGCLSWRRFLGSSGRGVKVVLVNITCDGGGDQMADPLPGRDARADLRWH